jgi:hypothetical protein
MNLRYFIVPQDQVKHCGPLPDGGVMLSSELLKAARALLRWEQRQLAEASSVSISTVKRLESQPGPITANAVTVAALRRALEEGGVDFIPANGGGPGVRLRKS